MLLARATVQSNNAAVAKGSTPDGALKEGSALLQAAIEVRTRMRHYRALAGTGIVGARFPPAPGYSPVRADNIQ